MALALSTIITDITTLSTSINSNVFIESARAAFRDGINEYEISDEEKAKLIAQYEANVSVGVITQIINLAKEFPELQTRVALQEEQKKLVTEQVTSQEAQTKKILHEIEEVKARTLKNYGIQIAQALDKTMSSTNLKTGMLDKQIISEMWRHRDMKAGVTIKNKSTYTTIENAKFEEARRHIAIKANQDNMYLKKADYKVAQLNAMAIDDDYIITSLQIDDVKTTIDSIPSGAITYTTAIGSTFTEVETTEITL